MELWKLHTLKISAPFLLCTASRTSTRPPTPSHLVHRRLKTTTTPTKKLPQHHPQLAQRSRIPPRRRTSSFIPHRDRSIMSNSVHLVTAPTVDTPQACLIVRDDRSAYIFGRLSEGMQRAFNARKISFASTRHVFLSGSAGWDQVGGLTGFLLTLAASTTSARENYEAQNKERAKKGLKPLKPQAHNEGVGIHGGDNISHLLACNRGIIFRQPINSHTYEYRKDSRTKPPSISEPDWQDDGLRVWKVPATRERSSSPRKRRRLSPEVGIANGQTEVDEDAEFKVEDHPLSDPEVARMIVDRLLWNGGPVLGTGSGTILVSRKVKDLKRSDAALITDNGVLRKYMGPFTGDKDAEGNEEMIPNPEDKAWVLPDEAIDAAEFKDGETWRLTDIPLPKTSYSQTSMSYIAKVHDRRGKFDRAAAEALGVDKKDFKHIINGQEVKGKDGQTVKPEMVLGDQMPGRGLIVADISGPDFVESFLERPEWSKKDLMANIPVMYWLLGPGLSNHPKIQQFMKDHSEMKHVICAPDTCPNMISNIGHAELQMMLRRIDPDRFPVPKYNNAVQAAAPTDPNIEFGRAGKTVKLMPRLLIEDDNLLPFPDLKASFNSVPEEVVRLAEQARVKASDPEFLAHVEESEKDIPNRDAEITCLGTGSSVPSKYRNVSGTLIRVPGVGNYLLDCGEGTMGQILRIFGVEKTAKILRDLRCVVISHIHADHHLGALSVFSSWYRQALQDGKPDSTLAVSCISRYRDTLQDMSQVEDFGFHRLRFPSCTIEGAEIDLATFPSEGENYGLTHIRRVLVPHCYRSMGTEIKLTSGLRIAYSGDCRPSAAFARECHGAHLLVHECTFGDDMSHHAKAKMHSTLGEALGVAKDMAARRLLLTHFSQRYVKADSLRWGDDGGKLEADVLMGFDFMSVKLGDFQKAALYLPALEKLMEKADE